MCYVHQKKAFEKNLKKLKNKQLHQKVFMQHLRLLRSMPTYELFFRCWGIIGDDWRTKGEIDFLTYFSTAWIYGTHCTWFLGAAPFGISRCNNVIEGGNFHLCFAF